MNLINKGKAFLARIQAPQISAVGVDAIAQLAHGESLAEMAAVALGEAADRVDDRHDVLNDANDDVLDAKRTLGTMKRRAANAAQQLTEAEILEAHVKSVAGAVGVNKVK